MQNTEKNNSKRVLDPNQAHLVLDASGLITQVGIVKQGHWLHWESQAEMALGGLYTGVKACLKATHTNLEDLEGFIFCEGPGSVLGIRLAAMMLRSWQALPPFSKKPIFRYSSLVIAAKMVEKHPQVVYPCLLLSEARQREWNQILLSEPGKTGPIIVIPDTALPSLKGPLWHIPQRKSWHSPPERAQRLEYNLEPHADIFNHPEIFDLTDEPNAFIAHPPEFKHWIPERHRGSHD